MFTEKDVNWNDLTTYQKRGACAVRKMVNKISPTNTVVPRCEWVIDDDIPIFTQYRDYVESRINFSEVDE